MAAITNIPGSSVQTPSWGRTLTEADYAALSDCWITREIADVAMLRRVDEHQGRQVVGQKGKRDCSGILIPYYWPGQTSPFNSRLRRDKPEWKVGRDGKLKSDRKYLSPPGGTNRLYIPPGVTLEQLADVNIPIAIVEGEKKALALWRLANHERDEPRFIPIAIAGVWNWRGKIGKTGGPKGEPLDVEGPITDLNRIASKGQPMFVVFDANVHSNDSVRWARRGLSRELATRGAEVKLVNLPEDCGVNGIDDLLAEWGPARVLELFETAVSGARLKVIPSPQFQSTHEGISRTTSRGDSLMQVSLTNFTASIVKNIHLDDGVDSKREIEIEAELLGSRYKFTIPASEFASMNWAIERIGGTAIIFPNQKEYARTAIQALSLAVTEQRIYTHTGWSEIHSGWAYLHAGGALAASGAISETEVRLWGTLSRYHIAPPPNPAEIKFALAATFRLLELAPPSISFPLLAATFRAVIGNADFSLHLVGATGTFKSEIAALHQQFFGATMKRMNLPGSWSSTANALEALSFHAKDALLVIDDFAPQGSGVDIARYHSAADRVFRSVGNQAGRGRLDSTAKLRESKPPRALILSTGEEIPRGQSVRARLLILEISNGEINPSTLTVCQRDAGDGVYAEGMAGFLQWMAGRYVETRTAFDAKASDYRTKAVSAGVHARTPDIVASLQASFDLFLQFAVASGAIDTSNAGNLSDRCWNALGEAAAAQAKHQGETEPAARFLSLLRSVLSSGRAHLEARHGGEPARAPESCGWRRNTSGNLDPLGDCIGWIDDDDNIYLEPSAAFRTAQIAARDIGEAFAISEQTLRKRLREKGLLASTDTARKTLTIRRTIGSSSKEVLHLLRHTVLPDAGADSSEETE